MDLLSVFKRGSAGPASVDTPPSLDSVATARRRARQRLIGATVLVVIAVVAFPMVFDATPRPVSVDVPIVIPRKEGSPPLAMPANGTSPDLAPPMIASSAPAPVVASNAQSPTAPGSTTAAGAAAGSGGAVITEGKDDAGKEVKPPVPDARVVMGQPGPPHVSKPAKPASKQVDKPADKPALAKAEPARPAPDDASRAKALLENKPVAKADAAPAPKPAPAVAAPAAAAGDTRFVVQVAAFSSEAPVQEMRSKLDKAGVKSFSQAVDTPQGKRYRVRVGPFNSRDEAEHAAAKIRSAGLSSSIVPL